jgi:hypothetical protein
LPFYYFGRFKSEKTLLHNQQQKALLMAINEQAWITINMQLISSCLSLITETNQYQKKVLYDNEAIYISAML